MQRKISSGFTLIELLVSMLVIVVVGSVIVVIFYSVLRGANKTNTLILVRQNGNYAISQMTKMIRDASSIDAPFSCAVTPPQTANFITFTEQDNTQIKLSCPTSEGGPVYAYNVLTGQTDTLIDTQSVSASCTFSCSQDPGSPTPLVEINLTVTQANETASNEHSASQNFHTSVALRNMN